MDANRARSPSISAAEVLADRWAGRAKTSGTRRDSAPEGGLAASPPPGYRLKVQRGTWARSFPGTMSLWILSKLPSTSEPCCCTSRLPGAGWCSGSCGDGCVRSIHRPVPPSVTDDLAHATFPISRPGYSMRDVDELRDRAQAWLLPQLSEPTVRQRWIRCRTPDSRRHAPDMTRAPSTPTSTRSSPDSREPTQARREVCASITRAYGRHPRPSAPPFTPTPP